MVRWLAVIVAVLLFLPAASAFSTSQRDLLISYDAAATPVIVAAGEIGIEGALSGGLFFGGTRDTSIDRIGKLVVVSRDGARLVENVVEGATLEITSGGMLWTQKNGSLEVAFEAPYALGLALPQTPLPAEPGKLPPSGFLLAGEKLGGTARSAGGRVDIAPLDAVITLRDASGQPLADWNARHVNADATQIGDTQDGGGLEVLFRAEGGFTSRIDAAIIAGAAGPAGDMILNVARAKEDRFAQTVDLLDKTSRSLGSSSPQFGGQDGPLKMLSPASGILNGALLLIPGDGSTLAATPIESRWGLTEFALGDLNIVRGDDMKIGWAQGQMRVEGEPGVALGREGFAMDGPVRVGIFPLISIFLWAIAIAGIVVWFVKRPPKGVPVFSLRLLSFGVYLVVLAGAFFMWDRSFAQTFGVSSIGTAMAEGISAATLPRIGVIFAMEMVPWGIAALLFALPVRIALGVGLRYLGRGKSYKGVATAGGLVALALLGPLYALYCFNLVWANAARMMGG